MCIDGNVMIRLISFCVVVSGEEGAEGTRRVVVMREKERRNETPIQQQQQQQRLRQSLRFFWNNRRASNGEKEKKKKRGGRREGLRLREGTHNTTRTVCLGVERRRRMKARGTLSSRR